MDSDDNAEIGPSGPNADDETVEQAAERRSAEEEEDLRESLAGLSRLAADRLLLEDLLTQVATYAVQAIPGADGAGLTLLEEDRADTIVATAPFVTEVDDIQYGMEQGPCISAAREGLTVMSGSLGGDPRWPRFGGWVARLGVHSVVSLPLITPDGGGRRYERLRPRQGRLRRPGRRTRRDLRRTGSDRGSQRPRPRTDPTAGRQAAVGTGSSRRHRPGRRDRDEPERQHRA
jgi:hypothetical protein